MCVWHVVSENTGQREEDSDCWRWTSRAANSEAGPHAHGSHSATGSRAKGDPATHSAVRTGLSSSDQIVITMHSSATATKRPENCRDDDCL